LPERAVSVYGTEGRGFESLQAYKAPQDTLRGFFVLSRFERRLNHSR
jgi:hypothetical protein